MALSNKSQLAKGEWSKWDNDFLEACRSIPFKKLLSLNIFKKLLHFTLGELGIL